MKCRHFSTAAIAILILSLSAVALSSTAGAGTVNLSSSTVAAGGTVTISGTGFGATKTIGIALGNEIAGSDVNMAYSGTGTGPYSGTISNKPIKPGSFVLTSDTSTGGGGGIVSTYTDTGTGTTTWSYDGTVMGTINYATGAWSRTSTVDVTGIAANYSATYTRYQYNLTPAAGVTTTATGTFSTSITVPNVSNSTYTVTVVDASGTIGTTTLIVSGVVPEGFTTGIVILLTISAVLLSSLALRKRSSVGSFNHSKL